jgi:hypothetical protein
MDLYMPERVAYLPPCLSLRGRYVPLLAPPAARRPNTKRDSGRGPPTWPLPL